MIVLHVYMINNDHSILFR